MIVRFKRWSSAVLIVCPAIMACAFAAKAPIVIPPDQTVAQIPVIQFQASTPGSLPTTSGHPAVGTVFAIQSMSSSQDVPVSPAPSQAPCIANGKCPELDGCVNNPTWPTKAESIT